MEGSGSVSDDAQIKIAVTMFLIYIICVKKVFTLGKVTKNVMKRLIISHRMKLADGA